MDIAMMTGWTTVDHTRDERPGRVAVRTLHLAPVEARVPDACPMCSGVQLVAAGHRVFEAVDAPIYGEQVRLHFRQPRFRCEARSGERRCGHVVLQPLPVEMAPRSRFTVRCAALIHRLQAAHRPVEQIADELGVGESTVRGHILRRRQRQAKEGDGPVLATPRYLGIDEVELRNLSDPAEPFVRKKRAVFTDLEMGQVVALLDDNTKTSVKAELRRLKAAGTIRGVAMDFHGPYRRAVRSVLRSDTPVVIDRFHIENRLHAAMDTVRRGELEELTPRPIVFQRHEIRMLRQMLWAKEKPIAPTRRIRFEEYLAHYPRTAAAYEAKRTFKAMWNQRCSSAQAAIDFDAWAKSIPESIKPAFASFIEIVGKNGEFVFAYFDLPISNGNAENMNRRIRKTLRAAPRLHLSTLRAKLLDQAHIAAQAGRTHFHCDECGDRTPEREDKVALHRHPRDKGEIWLCPLCLAGVTTRAPRRPSPRRRRSLPDGAQGMFVLPAATASAPGP